MFKITELTCRVCLEERNVLVNIYDDLEEFNTNLSNLLETYGGLQTDKNDIFPKYLCEDCTRELLITSKFREKCEKSKEIFCGLLENVNLIESEELSNSNNLIEYCTEDSSGAKIDDLIIQDHSTDKEENPENVSILEELVEQDIALPSLKNSIIESIKDTESSNLSEHKNVIEETVLSNDYTHQFNLNAEKSVEIESVNSMSWDNTPSIATIKSANAKSKRTHIFKCDVCGAKFKHAINLQKHLQKSHDPVQCYICSKCDHYFSLEPQFLKHIENCTYLEINTEECGNSNTEKIVTKTVETEQNRKCMYCERDFPTPFALRMHLRTHTGERPFQCKYCIKSFKTQSQLNVHHKRHTGQADFMCSVCNKTFYEQSNLTVHMRSHTGERPHVCTVCNKTFTRVFLLQFHMRTHTGEKPFKCNYCDKSFRQHTDLRSHLTIHTGKKQHTCILCGKSYTKRSHLVQHMRKHPNYNSSSGTGAIEEEQSIGESSVAAANTIQSYERNPEILYSFDKIIDSEDVVLL